MSAAVAAGVRAHLVRALEADLIGPFDDSGQEVLRLPPSRWYLTGFLAPASRAAPAGSGAATPVADTPDEDPLDDQNAAGDDQDDEETAGVDPEPKQPLRLPSSLGLSVLLPARPAGGGADDSVEVTVRWAEYVPEHPNDDRRKKPVWRRSAPCERVVRVPLDADVVARGVPVPDTVGVRLAGRLGEAAARGLADGARALSLFVINDRAIGDPRRPDVDFMFQVELELRHERGLLPRPNQRDLDSTDWDARVADLQFRERHEHAVGHGVSIAPVAAAADGVVRQVRTTWIPRTEVRTVITNEQAAPGVETSMEALAALDDGDALRAALAPLVDAYGAWIAGQRGLPLDEARRRTTRDGLMERAELARRRIARGIDVVAHDPRARTAFRLANRAMALQARRRSPERYPDGSGQVPRWRLFQLAFVLMNVPDVVDPRGSEHRDVVDLIFFPTGGGKTEAYLGVIAFTLVLRRLLGQERPDGGLGVAVILRYTLRLLTLDQLERATTLICALELLRRERGDLGGVRFAIGLWVGKSATANRLSEVAQQIVEWKTKGTASPLPIGKCPWCGHEIQPAGVVLRPDKKPREVVVACTQRACDFAGARSADGIPLVFVDEQVYRELPAFLVATVDKFAMLPWRGETGMLFGRAVARSGHSFFGPVDDVPRTGVERLPHGLRPPELIVQDELHLIAGPLGTMVGLYETAIEALCLRTEGPATIRPKILASTATVRHAAAQISALMGRGQAEIFPPMGVEEGETFFATVDRRRPGRMYVGVAAPGRAHKAILVRAYRALLGGARRRYDDADAPTQTADGYMTVVGYFNSLRELGGMRRLVEDDLRTRCARAADQHPVGFAGPHPWFASRELHEPVELTSREPTTAITRTKDRLKVPWRDDPIDVLLASNMISVGVDIPRLGVMVVAGQPKTTAEYIQASSRVGRDERYPGLVVTCFNNHKPRDRSHYEMFAAYHETFYRWVEVTSVTPFSGPALDRGLAGALVAITRLVDPTMTPADAAMLLPAHRAVGDAAAELLAARAGRKQPGGDRAHDDVLMRAKNLLDAWTRIVATSKEGAARRAYSPFDRDRAAGKSLLYTRLEAVEERNDDELKFCAPTSMRDVEATSHLWLVRGNLGGKR